ncbi:hypothetical protein NUBL2888_34280 [Klebsiella pneumoniae]|nr:hypothetical protein NUBL2888_34280 [Klebsiella pneumoniae]
MIKSANMPMDLILLLRIFFLAAIVHESEDTAYDSQYPEYNTNEFCRIHIIKTLLTTATTADPHPDDHEAHHAAQQCQNHEDYSDENFYTFCHKLISLFY